MLCIVGVGSLQRSNVNMRFDSAFFLAGLGDVLTTSVGLLLGFQETNPFFIPFLSTLIFLLVARFVDSKRLTSPRWIRTGIKGCLLIVAFSPVWSNLGVMLSMWFRGF